VFSSAAPQRSVALLQLPYQAHPDHVRPSPILSPIRSLQGLSSSCHPPAISSPTDVASGVFLHAAQHRFDFLFTFSLAPTAPQGTCYIYTVACGVLCHSVRAMAERYICLLLLFLTKIRAPMKTYTGGRIRGSALEEDDAESTSCQAWNRVPRTSWASVYEVGT